MRSWAFKCFMQVSGFDLHAPFEAEVNSHLRACFCRTLIDGTLRLAERETYIGRSRVAVFEISGAEPGDYLTGMHAGYCVVFPDSTVHMGIASTIRAAQGFAHRVLYRHPEMNRARESIVDADPESALRRVVPHLDKWPMRWSLDDPDLEIGEATVALFKPYLLSLLKKGLPDAKRCGHADQLFLLGHEVVRHWYLSNQNRTAKEIVADLISDDAGPLLKGSTEKEQRTFDRTCRKLHRFFETESAAN